MSGKEFVISIILNVANRVSAPLKFVRRELKGLQGEVSRVQDSFSKLSGATKSTYSLHNREVRRAVREVSALREAANVAGNVEVTASRKAAKEASRLTKVLDRVKTRWSQIKQEAEGAFKDLAVAYGSFKVAGFASSVVADVVEPAAQMQTALGQVASVGVKNLKLLQETAVKVSSEWSGITAPDFIAAAYDIKSAISNLSDAGVAKFTEFAAITAKATKATVGEMTNLLAVGYGIFKTQFKNLSDIQFGELFSAEVAKAVQLFRTTGSEMRMAIKNLGATATQLGVSMQEQLAVLGILQQTMEGAEAGTSYKYFIQSIISAGEKLGITVTDANGKLLSLVDIIAQLKKKFGENLDADAVVQLKKALGSDEAVRTLMLLWNKTDQLKQGMAALSEAGKKGMAGVEEMAAKMNRGFNEQFQILLQNLSNLKAAVGFAVVPLVIPVLKLVSAFFRLTAELLSSHPIVAKTVGILLLTGVVGASVVGTFLALRGALHVARLSWILFKGDLADAVKAVWRFNVALLKTASIIVREAVSAISLAAKETWKLTIEIVRQGKALAVLSYQKAVSGLLMLKRGFLVAATAVRAFTVTLLTNPVFLIIAAVAAAAFLIYKNWSKLKPFFTGLWRTITGVFTRAVGFIRENWRKLLELFLTINPITAPIIALKKLYSFVRSIDLFEAGKQLLIGLGKGMLAGVSYPLKVAKEAADKIVSKVKGLFGIKSPSRVFAEIGSFLSEGLSVGVKAKVPEVEKTVEFLYNVTIKGLQFGEIPVPQFALKLPRILSTYVPKSVKSVTSYVRNEKTTKSSVTKTVKQFISKIEINVHLPKGTPEEHAKTVAREVQRILEKQAMRAELDYDFA